jgi:hypothetical protein
MVKDIFSFIDDVGISAVGIMDRKGNFLSSKFKESFKEGSEEQ